MNKPLTVVHITETFVTGVYSYIRDLSEKLEQQSDIVNIVIYSNKRKGRLNEAFPAATKLLELNMVREISIKEDFNSFRELRRLLKKINPDVVHVHSSKAGFLGRLASINLKSKPKVFYTAHGFSFLRTDISTTKRRFYYFLEKTIAKLSNSITVACGDTELQYASNLGKAVLIRNGVDLDRVLSYYCVEPSGKKLVVGILGRISFPRNPSLFNKIALQFPHLDFIWIGGGELENEITASNITVTGWFDDKAEGYEFLNKVDIYLQTSLWEGLPIAVLEAMAFQKPVVASNVIGNKDAVIHENTGLLFNGFEEACAHIERLTRDEHLRNKLGKAGLERCRESFNTNENFHELIQMYRKR